MKLADVLDHYKYVAVSYHAISKLYEQSDCRQALPQNGFVSYRLAMKQ